MANPDAIVGNGGDLTVGNTVFLPNIGLTGRLLALGNDSQIIITDLTAESAAFLNNVSQEPIPNTVVLRTARAAIKSKLALLGAQIQQTPTSFTLEGAASSFANDTFTKTSDTTYSGFGAGSVLFFDASWSILDNLSTPVYQCSPENFPGGPWVDTGGGEPVPTLVTINDDTFALGIGLSTTPELIGIRIVKDLSQQANLQEWCDENSAAITWIDKACRLFLSKDPIQPTEAANKKYVDDTVAGAGVGGSWPIPNGADGDTVTGLALGFTPSRVLPFVRMPASGSPMYVSVVDGTITTDGFQFYIGPGLTDSADYILDYQLIP